MPSFTAPPLPLHKKSPSPHPPRTSPAVPSALKHSRRSHINLRHVCKAQEGQSSAVGEDELLKSRILESNGHLADCQSHKSEPQPEGLGLPSGHVAAQSKSHLSNVVPGVSWGAWCAYFEQADAATKRMDELAINLKEAVREEQYRQAAAIKAEITALDEQDAVASVQKLLKAALAEERYDDAASLSQSGFTGLAGWWAGQAEDDPVGHLLHIRKDYSRWTGRVFRPRDIAAMKVNKLTGFSRTPARSFVPQVKPVGSPIFEVFVRSKTDAMGETRYLHQSVSLQLPSFEASTMPRSKERTAPTRHSEHGSAPAAPTAPSAGPAGPVRLRISVHDDGTLHIRPLSVQQQQQQQPSVSSHVSNATRDRVSSSSSSSAAGQPVTGDPDLGSDEVVDVASQNAMSSLEENEESSVTIVAEHSDLEGNSRGLGGRHLSSTGRDEVMAELARLPATIELLGHDRLVYHVPDYHVDAGVEGMLASPGAGLQAVDRGTAASAVPSTVNEEAPHFEVIVPMPDARTASSASPVAMEAVPLEALGILADQVAQSLEAKTGCASAREEIAQAMQDVMQRVASGEPMSSIDIFINSPSSRQSTASRAAAPCQFTSFFYKRIAPDYVRTDPLSGLYLGSFGPHGPELLQLSRMVVDGEEMVQATKLTGDANVPAGLVSFRAKVARKHRMDGRDVYPDELGIMARYKGEGRVAQKGFSQPRWVDGELLVFNAKGNALTAGAELGFVWAVPGEKRFLILLNRVDLS